MSCIQSLIFVAPTGEFAGYGLAAAGPVQVCGVAGPSPWLLGLPPAVAGFQWYLVPVLSGGAGARLHLFMRRGNGNNMTVENAPQGVSGDGSRTPPGGGRWYLSEQRG
ncbi:hypothetical protein GCM10007170_44410 [Arthrobacter liuii]|uniref:Uncharacterized protein n=1 Tax=Arthrobacter liuii TaxID=1476996 RepID=A0ABQ2B149_9MICC|nr:hypothetical protein GCM10007170_44410 [Arthrobacter liuii]